jgi:methionyl-tRNA formyltransferase
MPLRVVFMGTPDFAVPTLTEIIGQGHEVVAAYTRAPAPAGRGMAPRPSPVERAAERFAIPVLTPRTLREPQAQAAFAAHEADVAVVVAYGLILPQAVLDAPRHGCLNIHASLLPRWRGAAPIHRAIMAGDAETGVCIMQMEAGLDTGPVLLREATPIGTAETTADLHDRLSAMGARLILQALDRLPDLHPEPQPTEGVTYAAKIDKAEARVDFTRPAAEVDRLIRGLSPFPGAWVSVGGERVKLLRSRLCPEDKGGSGVPGQVLGGFTIACGTDAIEVLEAQREGKRPMPAAEVLKGLTLPDRL